MNQCNAGTHVPSLVQGASARSTQHVASTKSGAAARLSATILASAELNGVVDIAMEHVQFFGNINEPISSSMTRRRASHPLLLPSNTRSVSRKYHLLQ